MGELLWRGNFGGHARAFRDRYLVGEVVWYHDPADLGERYWVGFVGSCCGDGRFSTPDEAQTAVEAALASHRKS